MSDARWNTVRTRSDGDFFFGVKTTGVFCRPTCRARQPLRKNVVFFDTTLEAQRAGFRACKKCRPEAPRQADERLVRACRLLEREERLSTSALADLVGMSPAHFSRAFKAMTGVTPQAYRRRLLAERARQALGEARTVTDAVYDAGFSASSRFYETVGPELGMPAKQARSHGAGVEVHFVIRRCSLGLLRVAWTVRGVCDVAFGDSEAELEAELRARFANAKLEAKTTPAWVEAIVACAEQPRALDVPLDIAGTAFQQRVWTALREIPLGKTLTYQQLATQLGMPTGSRAVARACATNELALVIPCHRVVRTGGALAGYRWGLKRKRTLLEREGAVP